MSKKISTCMCRLQNIAMRDLPRKCDYRTDTDAGQSDPYVPLCFAGDIIKEMAKICFNTLKIIVVKYGEIWFPWRNMVLLYSENCNNFSRLVSSPLSHKSQCNFYLFQPLKIVWLVDVHALELLVVRHRFVHKLADKAAELLLAVTDRYVRSPDDQLWSRVKVRRDFWCHPGRLLQNLYNIFSYKVHKIFVFILEVVGSYKILIYIFLQNS